MLCIGETNMNKIVPVFKNSQSSWGYKIIPPCGKCKIFLGLCGEYYGSTSKGVLNIHVREVVEDDVWGFLKGVIWVLEGIMEINQRGEGGFPSRGLSTSKGLIGGEKQHREWWESTVSIGKHLGKSEKIGRGHVLDSLVYSSMELGLPRRKKIGVEIDLNINYNFRIYSLLIF